MIDPHQLHCIKTNGHNLFDLKGAGPKCLRTLCEESAWFAPTKSPISLFSHPSGDICTRYIFHCSFLHSEPKLRCSIQIACECYIPIPIPTLCPLHKDDEKNKKQEETKKSWNSILTKMQKPVQKISKLAQPKKATSGYMLTRSGLVYQDVDGSTITNVTGCDDTEKVYLLIFLIMHTLTAVWTRQIKKLVKLRHPSKLLLRRDSRQASSP